MAASYLAPEQRPGGAPVLTRSRWEDGRGVYVNRVTGRPYAPHHADEVRFVFDDGPWRWGLCAGGEGSGKSTAGVIKSLERLRRKMSGILVSTDLPQFKKSLWPEFRDWCPWDEVVPAQRYRAAHSWEPLQGFTLAFTNGAKLLCGGIEDPSGWEGANVHFCHFDEAHRHPTPQALKVLDGRIRLAGTGGEPSQGWITSIPVKNWLYDYFGPEKPQAEDDPYRAFKRQSLYVRLRTADNAVNLADGYEAQRRASLTEDEAAQRLDAAWVDVADTTRFLSSMLLWDACRDDLPALTPHEPGVVAMDAGISHDCFSLVLLTRHPRDRARIAERATRIWYPPPGGVIDFGADDGPEQTLRAWCKAFAVQQVVYDPYQLHDMATRLTNQGVVYCEPFSQNDLRLIADKRLLDVITERRIAHTGDPELRRHLDNANKRMDAGEGKLRIVKRSRDGRIDGAVCLSMGVHSFLELNT